MLVSVSCGERPLWIIRFHCHDQAIQGTCIYVIQIVINGCINELITIGNHQSVVAVD
ncbi:hypothetical protein D3C78_1707990 [compost metagenome]